MLINYIKTAVRLIKREKGYSLLKLAGLAIGLACFVLLMMWVLDEAGWDRFHEYAPFIYRLESNTPAQPAALIPHLKANYPEIAEGVRFFNCSPLVVRSGDKVFEEDGFVLSDPEVFDVFTIPFVVGNPNSALTEPNTVVLTEAAAEKYFGNENPLGAVLTLENRLQVRVTGIVRNPPGNSDFQFDVLGEFRILSNFRKGYEAHWGNHEYYSYVRLAAGVEARALIPKIARTVMDREPGQANPLTLVPLGRIHLYEDGAIRYVAIFGLVAIFILAIAACNFPHNQSVEDVPYFIVNQKAVEEMKLKDPVGARFSLWGWNGTVLGVVKDFHFRPLREDLDPLLMFVFPRIYRLILVKIRPENGHTAEVLAGIKDVWEEFAPGTPFSYEFLDADYDRNYRAEQRMSKEFRYFSFLGIFISCLGLIGLAAYVAERKRKEIGIRRVLGAGLPDILRQINREFLWPILLSNLIAWPAAYWAMKTWLQFANFNPSPGWHGYCRLNIVRY